MRIRLNVLKLVLDNIIVYSSKLTYYIIDIRYFTNI